MRAGRMRHRITIQRERREGDVGFAPDGIGGYALAWVDIATVWAEVRPLSVREQSFAAQLQDARTHQVRLRARNDITAACRFVFKGRPFNIVGVMATDEIRHEMLIPCVEGVAT